MHGLPEFGYERDIDVVWKIVRNGDGDMYQEEMAQTFGGEDEHTQVASTVKTKFLPELLGVFPAVLKLFLTDLMPVKL